MTKLTLDMARCAWWARAWQVLRTQALPLAVFSFLAPLGYKALLEASAINMPMADAPLITWWLGLPYLIQVALMVPFMLLLSVPLVFAATGPFPSD